MSIDARDQIIPKPMRVVKQAGGFELEADMKIYFEPALTGSEQVAHYLAELLRPATGYNLEVAIWSDAPVHKGICLTSIGSDEEMGEESYKLSVKPGLISLKAGSAHGLFHAVQTLRQLLPPQIEEKTVQAGPWLILCCEITDRPRFQWRGAMLDVARNFFTLDEVKHLIDLLALYKINRLHLHLSDDQGWRIMIDKWPNLAGYGGKHSVKGGRSGYFTQADYSSIVAYAHSRFITVIPEIDVPGHTNAALSSYAELNADGIAPLPFSGMKVGFSTLVVDKEITYQFLADVFSELAKITPGPYLHVGGDEAHSTEPEEYRLFLDRLQPIIAAENKTMIGWGEITQADLAPSTIVQIWRKKDEDVQRALAQGLKMIISPSHHIYLDIKYTESSPLGQDWPGLIEVDQAYNWEPTTVYPGVSEEDVLGVEAPLWTETIRTVADLEYMFFPRLPGSAEIGWSPAVGRDWQEYKFRLAAHGRRWNRLGINFYRSPLVPWK